MITEEGYPYSVKKEYVMPMADSISIAIEQSFLTGSNEKTTEEELF